jgi:hypothetical protein
MISISPPAGQLGPESALVLKETTGGVVRTVAPPGWPCATPTRHVHGVHDKQTAVEGILRVYPNALANISDLLGGFNFHEDVSVRIYTDEPIGLLQAVTGR